MTRISSGSSGVRAFWSCLSSREGWIPALTDAITADAPARVLLLTLGSVPFWAVILLLHPDLQQLQVEVPVAASAPVVRTLIQRSMNQQVPDLGDGFWCDVPLMSEGDRSRRWVYAMPRILHHEVLETFRTIGIELGAMIPFSGLAFLEGGLGSEPGTVVLEAWRLPCGIAVGLRRGASLWMVRPLVLDPEEGPRVARELRQTLGFARQRWNFTAPQIRLRGPGRWRALATKWSGIRMRTDGDV